MILPLLVTASLSGQIATANLDFSKGSLADWEGAGFQFVPAGNDRPDGAWSRDADGGKGMIRFAFRIPENARQITFDAYAEVAGDNEPDNRLSVLLAGVDQKFLPRQVKTSAGTWSTSNRILLPWLGKPRTYAWDVSAHQGKLMQIVLSDQDDRPGHYVWAGNFRIVKSATPCSDILDADFGPFMLKLQKKNNLGPMARFESKHFTAISNASENFTKERLQNCEVFYDLFLNHFKGKGFAVNAPPQRLMIAIFDTHEGFDSYFGQKMANGIAGVYHTATNRLVLYDFAENRALLANKDAAIKRGNDISNPLKKERFVETVERKVNDVSKDANLSTTMHECAHQISFNCGLFKRGHDVPTSIAEGLATYCEATEEGDWTSLGNINPLRISALAAARGKFIPLADLLRNEHWLQTPQVLLGYGQSWALFSYLMKEHPEQLKRYLKIIENRRAPENRLDDFQEAFGNLQQFERRYQLYMLDMVAKHRPTAAR
jgi:hypothetical protein